MSKSDFTMAYAIKQKNRKKMARGGAVESAATEKRPMPKQTAADSEMVARASTIKPLVDSTVLDQPTVKQARKVSKTSLSRPPIRGSSVFTTRYRDEIEDDLHRMDTEKPDGGKSQPKSRYDDPAKTGRGPESMIDEERQHSSGRKAYAHGGKINEAVSMREAEEDGEEDPNGLTAMQSEPRPPEDEYMADHFAEGGEVSPEDEEDLEHGASIAATIMARKKRQMFAEGGMVDIEENGSATQRSALHKQNKDALLKENYDEDFEDLDIPLESEAVKLSDEDEHGMSRIQRIMSRMRKRSPITR